MRTRSVGKRKTPGDFRQCWQHLRPDIADQYHYPCLSTESPKNALFYTSLAAMLTGPSASLGWKSVYGIRMFSVVLLWDVLIAILIGNQKLLKRFAHALAWLERLSGIALILLALTVLALLLAA
jgi:hypothetical protein